METDPRTGLHNGWNVDAIRRAREATGRKGSDLSETAQKLKLKTDHERLLQAEIKTRKQRLQLTATEDELIPRDALDVFASTLLAELDQWVEEVVERVAESVPQKYRKVVRDRMRRELAARRKQVAVELEAAARDYDSRNGTPAEDGMVS